MPSFRKQINYQDGFFRKNNVEEYDYFLQEVISVLKEEEKTKYY